LSYWFAQNARWCENCRIHQLISQNRTRVLAMYIRSLPDRHSLAKLGRINQELTFFF
jgi:hypothetical protein